MNIPDECPRCGSARLVADYYEAVYQGVEIVDGSVYEYDGAYGSYDDGSTQDECIRCGSCSAEVVTFGKFLFVPDELVAAVHALLNAHEAKQEV